MIKDENFMKALSLASGFSVDELIKIFKYEEGATIMADYLPTSDADYPYADKKYMPKDLIRVNFDVLNWFEKANKNPNSIEGVTNNLWMVMAIGHETSHWGDWTKRSVRFENTGAPQLFGSTEVGYFFEYSTLKSAYPNYPIPSALGIGNFGSNISGFLKGFVKQNFIMLSNIFKP